MKLPDGGSGLLCLERNVSKSHLRSTYLVFWEDCLLLILGYHSTAYLDPASEGRSERQQRLKAEKEREQGNEKGEPKQADNDNLTPA